MAGLLLKELKIRGLVRRTLIVTPANLTFQWQRELKDKFREKFDVIRGDVLRANYGQPLAGTRPGHHLRLLGLAHRGRQGKPAPQPWDLVIVDEAHKMSAAGRDQKTLAYQLGEELSQMTDHYLLMTATPHKGDPEHFCRFLELLDPDVYGNVKSLEEAMREHEAPFYLRRVKEALVTFPDPDTGEVQKLFTKRDVRTAAFDLDGDELDFYDALTRYVEDQSIKAAATTPREAGRVGFTMAMLQRRLASSVYAVRRSLERMNAKAREDPRRPRRLPAGSRSKAPSPTTSTNLPEEEQQAIIDQLEEVVASVDPAALREEIVQLTRLIDQAKRLEGARTRSRSWSGSGTC